MNAPRGIPTSRAYWDLQAEKLMNRIFAPVDMIDLPSDADQSEFSALPAAASDQESSPTPTAAPAATAPRWQRARRPQASPPNDPPGPASSNPAPVNLAPVGTAEATPAQKPGLQATLASIKVHHQPLILVGAFAAAGLVLSLIHI